MNMTDAQTLAAQHAGVQLWLRKQIVMLGMVIALLFLPAGTLNWLWGWLFWLLMAAFVIAQYVFVARPNPALMAERSKVQQGSKRWDVVLTLFAAVLLPLVSWVVAGLDVRFGWTTGFPAWLNVLGAALFAGGYGVAIWAMASNPFFSATVRIQGERGHTVASGGPYRIVRHPGYAGALVFQIGSALLLGSWPALALNIVVAALLVIRTALEDKTLHAELAGYAEYARHARYRLLPGVW
jgi:protein-S-isoprenylcysteine O-methyltransferase Ste14